MSSAIQCQRSYAQALLVNRQALDDAQQANDALLATQLLKAAFQTDVEPILQKVRRDAGAAADPLNTYRSSGYRQRMAVKRPAAGRSSGIV
jgi:L-rhamnose isomerase/sugar isomerase